MQPCRDPGGVVRDAPSAVALRTRDPVSRGANIRRWRIVRRSGLCSRPPRTSRTTVRSTTVRSTMVRSTTVRDRRSSAPGPATDGRAEPSLRGQPEGPRRPRRRPRDGRPGRGRARPDHPRRRRGWARSRSGRRRTRESGPYGRDVIRGPLAPRRPRRQFAITEPGPSGAVRHDRRRDVGSVCASPGHPGAAPTGSEVIPLHPVRARPRSLS